MTFSYPFCNLKFDLTPDFRVKISFSTVITALCFEEMEYGHQYIAKSILKGYGCHQGTQGTQG